MPQTKKAATLQSAQNLRTIAQLRGELAKYRLVEKTITKQLARAETQKASKFIKTLQPPSYLYKAMEQQFQHS